MQDPAQYFGNIAQMILQSAQAARAQEEEQARRAQEMAYREQELGLRRDQLADQRRATDAQLEGMALDTTEKKRRLQKAERTDAAAEIDRQIYRMNYGESPEDFAARTERAQADQALRTGAANTQKAEIEAASALDKNRLGLEGDQARIDAARSQQALADFQLGESKRLAELNQKILAGQLRAAELKNSAEAMDLAQKRFENFYSRMGKLTPAQATALDADMRGKYVSAALEAVQRSSIKVDEMGNQSFDIDAFQKNMAKVDEMANMAAKLSMLKASDPMKARAVQAQVRDLVQTAARATNDPNVLGPLVVRATEMALKSVQGETPPPAAATTTQPEPGRIALKVGATKAAKMQAKGVAKEAKDSAISEYLANNPADYEKVRKLESARIGREATDEEVLFRIRSFASEKERNLETLSAVKRVVEELLGPQRSLVKSPAPFRGGP